MRFRPLCFHLSVNFAANSNRNGTEMQEKYGVAISSQQSAISSQPHKVGAV